jgi:tryptophan-rich sensory protein
MTHARQLAAAARWTALAVALAICFAVAAFGARFAPGPWYAALAKPFWTPPNWIFGPVWTLLYTMMAVSAWLVWLRADGSGRVRNALLLFAVQLLLNGAWSWLFFGGHRMGLALAEILVLWAFILATTVAFWRIRRWAGILLLPYLGWVGFASLLNAALWWLNRAP